MVCSISLSSARHSQQASRCLRICEASRAGSSPSRKRSSRSSPGCSVSTLLTVYLSQLCDGAAKKFTYGGRTDSEHGRDVGIAEAFQADTQTPPLLVRKVLHSPVEADHPFTLEQPLLRIQLRIRQPPLDIWLKLRVGTLA